jgi:molybdenum cofactor cytidylyltransferase
MGGAKQVLVLTTPAGTKPLVAAAYDAIRPLCQEMIVVVGHAAEVVSAALGERRFHPVRSNPDSPMFESIRAGIGAAHEIDESATIVLQPGDHPHVVASTLDALADWSLKRPGQAIIPQYNASGGHPVLIPPAVAATLLGESCPNGLGEFWIAHPELCNRVPLDDPGVLRDVDTPGDLCDP